jgi:hypothetical protein
MTNEIPTDKVINEFRNRGGRNAILGLYCATALAAIPVAIHTLATMPFPENGLVSGLAWGFGVIGAVVTLGYSVPKRFLIWNSPNHMFVTQNLLNSFFGNDEVDIAYGAGTHACYPWEKRNENGNISLEEDTVEFGFNITLPDGALSGKAAYWIRPDHMHPVVFLRSVASVAEEIKTLIIAEIQKYVGSDEFRNLDVPTIDTSVIVNLINSRLAEVLGGDSARAEIEKRNGVIISGASVAELSVSGDLSKTLSGVSEAKAAQLGTAILLGMKDEREVNEALKTGLISQEDVARARRDFLSISGNLEGMTVSRSEFDLNIRGLSPEIVDKLTEFAKTPGAQALVTSAASRSRGSNKPKGKPKS